MSDAPVIAAIAHDPAAAPRDLLAQALAASGFWDALEAVRRRTRRKRQSLRVVIKPDLAVFARAGATGTDPRLVEHLIDLMIAQGYARIDVVDAPGRADLWALNREVPVLADLAGYRWTTDDGHAYDVLDLGEDLVPLPDLPDGVLGGTPLARTWLEADVRLVFARSKTDEEDGYHLGLQTLLGVLPLRDKDYHYRRRLDPADVARDLLRAAPPHFTLIDATVSNHGAAGSRRADPLPTHTVIASADLLLADWAGALKMGLDPYTSRPHAALLRTGGLPRRHRLDGDCAPYAGWRNVPVLLRDSVRARNQSPALVSALEPWLQQVDTELFPFRSDIDERVNALLAGVTGTRPLELWGLTLVNFWLGAVVRAAETGRILADKDGLRRRATSLGFDASAFPTDDYTAVIDYMEPLAALVHAMPADRNGLRWRYLDGSVLFEYRQLVERPYDAFVARVDVASAVRTMNDSIGGTHVVLARDDQGRVIRQAERNIYLPQPNWIALFGGDVIDVGKLEVVQYGADTQRIVWRTVTSANGSAQFDDGIVTFARQPGDTTSVTIVARQKFALPPALEAMQLDRFPQVKDALVSDAYTTYFSRTVANFLATYEGRDPAIGRDWDAAHGEPGTPGERGPVAMIVDAVRQIEAWLAPLLVRRAPGRAPGDVDADGFRHFDGPSGTSATDGPANLVGEFVGGLLDALRRDLTWKGDAPGPSPWRSP